METILRLLKGSKAKYVKADVFELTYREEEFVIELSKPYIKFGNLNSVNVYTFSYEGFEYLLGNYDDLTLAANAIHLEVCNREFWNGLS